MSRVEGRPAVVVPAISAGSSITTVRSLARHGVRTIVVGESDGSAVFKSKYCHEQLVVPSPSTDLDGYREALLRLAARPDVVTIVPLREPDIYVLAKYRDEFADHVTTPWPKFDTVRASQDWLKLRAVATDAGVPIPETRPLDEWETWDRPAVIKSRYSIMESKNRLVSPGIHFVQPGDDPDIDAIVAEMGHVPIVQEFVPGDAEHGFFALYDEGESLATFQHRRIRSYTYSGGASTYRKSIADSALAAEGAKLLDAFDWHGPAMVEFKHDPRDDSFRLMEINPRFWGSLALAVHAGVDFPYLYYRLAVGDPIQSHGYDVGVGSHLLRGEVSYLHSVLRYDYDHVQRPRLTQIVPTMVTSFVTQPQFDYLSLDDPLPFLVDFFGAAGDLVPESLRNRFAAEKDSLVHQRARVRD